MYTYYVDTAGSIACTRCYAQDPCEATKYVGIEPAECSRCDKDIEASDQRHPEEDDNPLAGYYCPACGEALEEGHDCSEIDVLAQTAWNNYKSGICPCGNAECGGIEWLLDGNDPFERIVADL